MKEETINWEFHYEKVVNYYIGQYRFKANLVSYNDFLTGYSLFALGKSMGFTTTLKELTNFLQMANVVLKTDLEQETYHEAMGDIQTSLEEISRPRM